MLNIIIGLYFLLIIGIGVLSRFQVKSPADYYVAGKKGGIFQVSGSLLATILGGSAILGTFELSHKNGWAAIWFILCASAGLFLLAPISKYVSRYGQYTLPQLLKKFYGRNAEIIASVIIPVAWLGIIAAQIIGAAKILNAIVFDNYTLAAIIAGGVFIAYTVLGGQKSILKTDLLQSALIIGSITFIFFLSTNMGEINTTTTKAVFNEGFNGIDLIILFLTYSTTFIVGPDIYSRIFCARSEKTAKRSVLLTAITLVPFAFIITYVGIHSVQNGAGAGISAMIISWKSQFPVWITGLLIAALLSAVMSSADTTLLTASMILSELMFGALDTKKTYMATKLFVVIIGILSLLVSLFVTSIIQSLLFALSFFAGAFFVPTVAGLSGIKCRQGRAVIAIVAGGVIALSGKITGAYFSGVYGNLLIILSFIVNGLILFSGARKK